MVFGASYEADRLNDDPNNDIRVILDVIARLSIEAKTQLAQCTVRDFNVGFHCWDSLLGFMGIQLFSDAGSDFSRGRFRMFGLDHPLPNALSRRYP